MGDERRGQRKQSTATDMATSMSRSANYSRQSYVSTTTDSSGPQFSHGSSSVATSPGALVYDYQNISSQFNFNEKTPYNCYFPSSSLTPYETNGNDFATAGSWLPHDQGLSGDYPPVLQEFEPQPHQQAITQERFTTSDLGWTGECKELSWYDFCPSAGELLPLFVLKKNLSASMHTPTRVYLDDQTHRRQGEKSFACKFPSVGGLCRLKKGKAAVFRRQPDLIRHYMNVHVPPKLRQQIFCDYERCGRAAGGDAITRKDHLREHYRETHLEDLILSSLLPEDVETWWASRDLKTAKWRCSKCLSRNKVSSGWICRTCHRPCEKERVRRREQEMLTRYSERTVVSSVLEVPQHQEYHTDNVPLDLDSVCGTCYGSSSPEYPCEVCHGSVSNNYSDYGDQSSLTYTNAY